MTITERTLKRWRREALEAKELIPIGRSAVEDHVRQSADRILRMTQELLDQHLLKKEKR